MRKYQNIRLMVQKVTLQLGWKKFLLLKKAKYMGRFIKNIYKTQIKQNLELLKKKKR